MKNISGIVFGSISRTCLGVAMASTLAAAAPGLAQAPITTQQTLLDRIQIEDLITSYYYNLGKGNTKAFESYYVDDAVFDVNGKIFRGRENIQKAYHGETDGPAPAGTFHMLLNNPLIEVHGDKATARFIWTGIRSDTVKAPPRLVEQGREYDILVKQNGQWRIKQRTIISDAALQDEFDGIYKPRKDYDPLKSE